MDKQDGNQERPTDYNRRRFRSVLLLLILLSPFITNQVWVVTENRLFYWEARVFFGLEAVLIGMLLLAYPTLIVRVIDKYFLTSNPVTYPKDWSLSTRLKFTVLSIALIGTGLVFLLAFYERVLTNNMCIQCP